MPGSGVAPIVSNLLTPALRAKLAQNKDCTISRQEVVALATQIASLEAKVQELEKRPVNAQATTAPILGALQGLDLDKLRHEAIQVAACAARIAALVDAGRGRV